MVIGIGQHRAARDQAGLVGGHGVATALGIRAEGAVGVLECGRRVLNAARGHLVGQVQLGRRALLHADRRAVQVLQLGDVGVLGHHDALAIIERGSDEVAAVVGVARQRPGGVADEHVNLAALQGRKALFGGQRAILHLAHVVEDRRRQGLAEVNVEAAVAPQDSLE